MTRWIYVETRGGYHLGKLMADPEEAEAVIRKALAANAARGALPTQLCRQDGRPDDEGRVWFTLFQVW